ncbi:MAG: hypothetical protein ACTHJW_12000 [Streptosporangiaceae bacterium]
MSEPDAVPLPREGEVFFDVRGESRTMRLSWYADSSVAVFSIWQGNRCTGTFRLPFADLVRMVETLQAGPPSRGADRASRHPGQPSHANASPDPGYGYPEPAGYGQPATYAPAHGYGSGPHYGAGPGYGPEYGEPYGDAGRHGGGDQYYGTEYPAASGGQGYGPPDRYGAPDGYGAPGPYRQNDYGAGEATRYVPDVAPQTGHYRAAADYLREAHGYAESPGYGEPHGHAESRGYPGQAEPPRHRQHSDYREEHSGAYRGETQFLAAPPAASAPHQGDAQTAGWRDDLTEPQGEPSLTGYPARPAKTEQNTPDWGPATAHYRAR